MTQQSFNAAIMHSRIYHLYRRLCAGASMVAQNTSYAALFFCLLFAALFLDVIRDKLFLANLPDFLIAPFSAIYHLMFIILVAIGIPALLIAWGTPKGELLSHGNLERVGFVNHAGEAPILISVQRDNHNPRLWIWEYDPCGIPPEEWEKKKPWLETILNVCVDDIRWGPARKSVCVYAVPAENGLPEMLKWNPSFLLRENFVLVLGESICRSISVNLVDTPHVLLAGSTGSGKTVLLKLLLMQAIQKGAEVWIADFKSGVDFPGWWRKNCRMCFDEDDLLPMLDELVETLERRKKLLADCELPNIDAYHIAACVPEDRKERRIIFACDEVAELTSKAGRNKEDKEKIDAIIRRLATIARLGRAVNISLILATQRPDAEVIPGQIKNNIDFRVCGRADNVLSQIVLDNTAASDLIPKDAKGRFLLHDGTLFQAYHLDERDNGIP